MIKLGFFGAAGEVTGSCYLVQTERALVMVDFGLHQGEREADEHNRRLPPIDPTRLDAVILTHGHLDHCGRLPLLHSGGYNGKIFTTHASVSLAKLILEDSAEIQEADAERETRRALAEGRKPIRPLYTSHDVKKVLPLFAGVDYDRSVEIAPGISARFIEAGHILGSASVLMTIEHGPTNGNNHRERTRILFSGDIGVSGSPILRDPTPANSADVVILESTYGDRDHRPLDQTRQELLDILLDCQQCRGKILIPAFAIGRTQDLIYHMGDFLREGKLQSLSVFVDSPMATDASDLYRQHVELYDCEAHALLKRGVNPLMFQGLRYVKTIEESKRLNQRTDGIVVIAASGMCTGGRIVHHLSNSLHRPETRVVIVGYQGHGTLGRRLVDKADRVRIFGEDIPVRARIHTLGGFSAHAGQSALLNWAAPLKGVARRWILTHGEDKPRAALAVKLKERFGISADMPQYGETIEL
jgi:metallo-beta-lactamase family protein